ncbi:hypothetical protein ACFWAD_16010 [Rhodococcus sp. NPDC059969]|uniref:hypothetical protein n=1 Tax=unclassified Rhodococcus (in: high G+C Gram-positive bacteria) TaxID=192944 RepID=UPI00366B384A
MSDKLLINARRRNSYRATVLALTFILGLGIAGCSPSESGETLTAATTPAAPSVYTLPSYMTDYRNQWIADPGTDLFSEEGTVVRAFVESDNIVNSSGDTAQAYPGFARATEDTRGTVSSDRRYVSAPDVPPRTYRGTSFNRILSIQTITAGYPGDSTVVAYVCADAYDTDFDGRQPDWFRPMSASYEIRMHNTAPTPTDAAYPRFEGPRDAPASDIFGGWVFDQFTSSTSNREHKDECYDWFESRHDQRYSRLSTDFTPPLVLPNYPGWPEGAAR